LQPHPQDNGRATYARQLKKNDGRLDWSLSAETLARQVRAYTPWPGAFTIWQGQPLKILRARADLGRSAEPGLVVESDNALAVGTSEGVLVLEEVQPAGRKLMLAGAFARGARDLAGSVLPN
jgi:methionyl-tRNA formyltransferase